MWQMSMWPLVFTAVAWRTFKPPRVKPCVTPPCVTKNASDWQRSLPSLDETRRALEASQKAYKCDQVALQVGFGGHTNARAGRKGTVACIGDKPGFWWPPFVATSTFNIKRHMLTYYDRVPALTISFKGTAPTAKNADVFWKNVHSDLTVWKIPMGDHPWWRNFPFTGVGKNDTGMAYGFQSTYDGDGVDAALFKELRRFDDIHPLLVTGHSLGGALATIFGARYALMHPNRKVRVVTFGALRVGDAKFRELTESLPNLAIARIVNEDDIAPRFPPASAGYSHVGHTIYLSRNSEPSVNAWTNERGDGEWNLAKIILPWRVPKSVVPKSVTDHLLKGSNGYINMTGQAISGENWPRLPVAPHTFNHSQDTEKLMNRYRAEYEEIDDPDALRVGQANSLPYKIVYYVVLYDALCRAQRYYYPGYYDVLSHAYLPIVASIMYLDLTSSYSVNYRIIERIMIGLWVVLCFYTAYSFVALLVRCFVYYLLYMIFGPPKEKRDWMKQLDWRFLFFLFLSFGKEIGVFFVLDEFLLLAVLCADMVLLLWQTEKLLQKELVLWPFRKASDSDVTSSLIRETLDRLSDASAPMGGSPLTRA